MYASNVQTIQKVHIQIVNATMVSSVFVLVNALNVHLILQVCGKTIDQISMCLKCIVKYSICSGIYPECECELLDHSYSAYINKCYIECGSDSAGLYPKCNCDEPRTYYDPEEFACKSNVGRECPKESIGIGPDCLCVDDDFQFLEVSWRCYSKNVTFAYPSMAQCPEGGNKWPQCNVEIDRNTLLSLVG